MKAVYQQHCFYNAPSHESIEQVVFLGPWRYALLVHNGVDWSIQEFFDKKVRRNRILKNLFSAKDRGVKPVLFIPRDGQLALLAGHRIFSWEYPGAKTRKELLYFAREEMKALSISSVKVMDDGSLLLGYGPSYEESCCYSIASKVKGGYILEQAPRSLNQEELRHLAYIALRPSISDIIPRGRRFFFHTLGTYRNWDRYEPECSILIEKDDKGQILGSRDLHKGLGFFTGSGSYLGVKPFGHESLLYFYSLEEEKSFMFTMDDSVVWSLDSVDTRYSLHGPYLAAWNRQSLILSNFTNSPEADSDS